jgi:hypothetical protein
MQWVATDLAGIQLKSKDSSGVYSAPELFDALSEIYQFIFLDVEASRVMVLQEKVKKHIKTLLRLIRGGLGGSVGSRFSIAGIVGTVSSLFSKSKGEEYHDIVKQLYELGHSTDRLANTILALMVVSGVELTLALTNVFHLYLGSPASSDLAKAATSNTDLDGFVYEALRLDPCFRGVFRVANKDQTIAGYNFKQGDSVFLDIHSANVDEAVVTNAASVEPNRSTQGRLMADGVFRYLGEPLTVTIISETLRAVYTFNNVRRAPGQSGALPRFKHHTRPELMFAYLNNDQLLSEWPTSMSIQYDA